MNHVNMDTRNLFSTLAAAFLALMFTVSPAHALLISNGDGTVTDTDTNLMWLMNTNQSNTPMNWWDSTNWAGSLDYAGFDDWRLPSALNVDGTGPCFGDGCTGSEIGHLYFTELLNEDDDTTLNYGPFVNIDLNRTPPAYSRYWLSTELGFPGSSGAMMFLLTKGDQGGNNKNQLAYAWAVRDIPEPTTLSLFVLAIIVLILPNSILDLRRLSQLAIQG